jgi:hypothetical protein
MYIHENVHLRTVSYELGSTHNERSSIFKMAAEKWRGRVVTDTPYDHHVTNSWFRFRFVLESSSY